MSSPFQKIPHEAQISISHYQELPRIEQKAEQDSVTQAAQHCLIEEGSSQEANSPESSRVGMLIEQIKSIRENYERGLEALERSQANISKAIFEQKLTQIKNDYTAKMKPLIEKWDQTTNWHPSNTKELEQSLKFEEIRALIYHHKIPIQPEAQKEFNLIKNGFEALRGKYSNDPDGLKEIDKLSELLSRLEKISLSGYPSEKIFAAVNFLNINLELFPQKQELRTNIKQSISLAEKTLAADQEIMILKRKLKALDVAINPKEISKLKNDLSESKSTLFKINQEQKEIINKDINLLVSSFAEDEAAMSLIKNSLKNLQKTLQETNEPEMISQLRKEVDSSAIDLIRLNAAVAQKSAIKTDIQTLLDLAAEGKEKFPEKDTFKDFFSKGSELDQKIDFLKNALKAVEKTYSLQELTQLKKEVEGSILSIIRLNAHLFEENKKEPSNASQVEVVFPLEKNLFSKSAWSTTSEEASGQMEKFQEQFLHSYRDVMKETLERMNQELTKESKPVFRPTLDPPEDKSEILFTFLTHHLTKSSLEELPKLPSNEISRLLQEKIEILKVASKWLSYPFLHNNEHLHKVNEQFAIKEPFKSLISQITEHCEKICSKLSLNVPEVGQLREIFNQLFKVKIVPQPGEEDPLPITKQGTLESLRLDAKKEERHALIKAFAKDLRTQCASDFNKIRSNELLEQNSPLAERFNLITKFIQKQILTQDTPKQRAEAMKFFINVQTELLREDPVIDYHSAYAIQSALEGSTIARLSKSIKMLSQEKKNLLEERSRLFSIYSNFPNLRKAMRDHPNHIPWLGLITKDLVAIQENSKIISDQVNPYRIAGLGNAISPILILQRNLHEKFSSKETREQKFNLKKLFSAESFYSDKDAYNRSLELEPKEIKNQS